MRFISTLFVTTALLSQTESETGASPETAVPTASGTATVGTPTLESKIEGDLNIAADVGAALGGPIGAAVAGVLPVAESAVNSVIAEAPHQTALKDIVNIVQAAGPVVAAGAAADPAIASVVSGPMSAIESALADLKKAFSWL